MDLLEKIAFQVGFTSSADYILKFVMPVIGISFVIFIVLLLVVQVNVLFALSILLLGVAFVFLYPMILYERKKVNIDENLHLFITYAGTISTMKIGRAVLFRRIAQKKIFGELSNVSNKIYYLAKSWNLGFSKSCRKVGKLIPSKVFADFLDRFAVIMDFGEDLDIFMVDEQDSMMEAFSTQYKESLENIKMIQNVFISLTISAAFLMSVGILLPLVLGTPIEIVLRYSVLGMLGLDAMIFVMIVAFVPGDRIPHMLPIKSEGMVRLKKGLFICIPITIMLLILTILFSKLPFMINLSISLSPLLYVGYTAKQEEDIILRRETMFPAFTRTLGSAIESRGGAILSALFSIRVHDFSHIDKMIVNIYRRLRLGNDKIKCWLYFAGETGSHLIFHFVRIFSESIYLGGSPEKIGEIVSKNFSKLLSLRKLRLQLTGSMRGSFYGTLLGFSAAIYMTTEVASMLAKIFSQPFQQASDSSLGDVVSSIAPQIPEVDMVMAGIYIGVLVILHSLVSSFMLKVMDGGFKSGALLDFPLMVWLGSLVSIIIPYAAKTLFPGVGLVAG